MSNKDVTTNKKQRITGVRKSSRDGKPQQRRNLLKGHWHTVAVLLIMYDVIAVNLAYGLALWLRFDCKFSAIPSPYLEAWYKFAPFYTAFCLLVFWRTRLYKSIWKYASYSELLYLIAATAITGLFHTIGITALFKRMPISYYVIGIMRADEKWAVITAGILSMLAFGGIMVIGLNSIVTLHRDMNTRQGYMLFMTPNSCYKILGAKVIENGLSMLVTGAFFFGLGALDIMLLFSKFATVNELWNLMADLIHSFNQQIQINAAGLACFFLNLLTGWFAMVIMAYLADVISAALLNGKKWNGILSFVLFLVLVVALRLLKGLAATLFLPKGTDINTVMLVYSAVALLFSAALYFCTAQIMERKLSV